MVLTESFSTVDSTAFRNRAKATPRDRGLVNRMSGRTKELCLLRWTVEIALHHRLV